MQRVRANERKTKHLSTQREAFSSTYFLHSITHDSLPHIPPLTPSWFSSPSDSAYPAYPAPQNRWRPHTLSVAKCSFSFPVTPNSITAENLPISCTQKPKYPTPIRVVFLRLPISGVLASGVRTSCFSLRDEAVRRIAFHIISQCCATLQTAAHSCTIQSIVPGPHFPCHEVALIRRAQAPLPII